MNHATVEACAKFHFPDATEDDVQALLWECTSYPVCGFDYACMQIAELRDKANTVEDAWRLSMGEMDRQWKELRPAASQEGAP